MDSFTRQNIKDVRNKIQSALDELGEDEYSEEDIRLMRIKFICDMGN